MATTREKKKGANQSPPSITRENILQTALAMTREEGLDNISMRKLAARLSIGTMSTYYYFNNRAKIINAIVDEVVSQTTAIPVVDTLSWQDELRLILKHIYDVMIQYPGVARTFYEQSILEPGVRSAQRMVLADRLMKVFRTAGMDPLEARRQLIISLGLILTLADRKSRREMRVEEFQQTVERERKLYAEQFPNYVWSISSDSSFDALDTNNTAIEIYIRGVQETLSSIAR